MTIELKIPDAGESIEAVQIVEWLKQEGEEVEEDENLVELETDKASMTLPAPASGVLSKILKGAGESAAVGEIIGRLEETANRRGSESNGEQGEGNSKTGAEAVAGEEEEEEEEGQREVQEEKGETHGQFEGADESRFQDGEPAESDKREREATPVTATPSARRELRKHKLSLRDVEFEGTRLRRKDVQRHVKQSELGGPAARSPAERVELRDDELTEVVPMSPIRRRIAERLVRAQQQAALLTTFNQVDMSAVMAIRQHHREDFRGEYEVDLGYMSFFVKAAVDALRRFPAVNAEVRGDNIVYRNYFHIGIAVGSERGLVVPVLRHAERMSFAEIEAAIDSFVQRADRNQLEPDELQGGTFTISNGGVYGSLLSTPIVNPPQSGVLGMHAIEDRPVARRGAVMIRPMMYVALSYDHRIIDGREAVMFLRRVKDAIEEPARMLIEI